MKKMVIAGIMTVAVSLFADVKLNDVKVVDNIGFAGLNKTISKADKSAAGRWYLRRAQYTTYKTVRDDEFELEGAVEEAYKALISKIKEENKNFIGKTSELRLGSEFSKYDFKKQLFPISVMEKNSVVTFGGDQIIYTGSYGLQLSFDNVNNSHSVLPMVKTDARTFTKSRKSSNGNVNRDLTVRYSFIIKSIESSIDNLNKCNERFSRCNQIEEPKMIGHITKMEILDKDGKVLHTYSDYK